MIKPKELSFLRAIESSAKRKFVTEPEAAGRSKFIRDRDRLLFSKEFRRPEGKTQVFINGFDDHIRNRLTHTLEVSQIAQSISDYFGFERYLSEAISLGHDVGHTPFGHVGERVLNHFTNNCLNYGDYCIKDKADHGFKHNWQGVKVVSTLERISPHYKGLNLTNYTIWGILNHSALKYKPCKRYNNGKCLYNHNGNNCIVNNHSFSLEHYLKFTNTFDNQSWTFEGLIVRLADEIAQRHHDIEDGLIAGIIDRKELVDRFSDIFKSYLTESQKDILLKIKETNNINYAVHDISSLILSFYSKHLIDNTTNNIQSFLKTYHVKNRQDFNSFKKSNDPSFNPNDIVKFSDDFEANDDYFKKYLISRVLNSHLAQTMDGKATHVLKSIIQAYLENPKQLPDGTIITLIQNYLSKENFDKLIKNKSPKLLVGIMRENVDDIYNNYDDDKFKAVLMRTIADFIAGMTDKFALSQYKMLIGSDNFWMK